MRPALIETIRVRNGSAPLWPLHLGRLVTSCRALGVPFPASLDVPAGGSDRVHRVETSGQGVTVTTRSVGTASPVRLTVASVPHRPYPHKTTDRAQFGLALSEARAAGADDALMLTHGGDVAEAAIWSLFWWEDDRLCAPPLEFMILPGVARARLAEVAGGIVERRAGPDALVERGAFVANAVRGVVPVRSIEGREIVTAVHTADVARTFWG